MRSLLTLFSVLLCVRHTAQSDVLEGATICAGLTCETIANPTDPQTQTPFMEVDLESSMEFVIELSGVTQQTLI
jgi:hypothetical protein